MASYQPVSKGSFITVARLLKTAQAWRGQTCPYITLILQYDQGATANSALQDPLGTYNTNKQLINLENSLRNQLKERGGTFAEKSHFQVIEAMKISSDLLIGIKPDKISVQLTDDEALYYTVIKDSLIINLSHYISSDCYDLDEALFSIYDGRRNILNFAGNLQSLVLNANKVLENYGIKFPQFA